MTATTVTTTVVGEIAPANWPRVALHSLVRFQNGADYKEVEDPDGIFDVIGSGGPFAKASRYLYDGESVLFGRKGTIDRPRYIRGRFWTVDTMFYTQLSPRIVGRFLYYWATTIPFERISTNTALPSITQAELGQLRVPLPSIPDQRAIAEYLDRETAKIDALVAKQEQLIAILLEHRSAAVTAAIDTQQDGSRLKHVVTSIRQGWSPQCEGVPADGVTEWGILKTGCVNGGVFRPTENKKLPEDEEPRPQNAVRIGEMVVSRASTQELVGSAGVVTKDYPRLMLSDLTYGLEFNEDAAVPAFVAHVLGTPRLRGLIRATAKGASHSMQKLSQGDILNLPMTLPPVSQQRHILKRLQGQTSEIDGMLAKARDLTAVIKERRAALISAAVTGQIDVSDYAKGA